VRRDGRAEVTPKPYTGIGGGGISKMTALARERSDVRRGVRFCVSRVAADIR